MASEPGGDGRYVVCGRTALLMRLGFVERKTQPPEDSELPKALAALLGHVPEGAARTLAELEAECAGTRSWRAGVSAGMFPGC